jgi:hypothetical protein
MWYNFKILNSLRCESCPLTVSAAFYYSVASLTPSTYLPYVFLLSKILQYMEGEGGRLTVQTNTVLPHSPLKQCLISGLIDSGKLQFTYP